MKKKEFSIIYGKVDKDLVIRKVKGYVDEKINVGYWKDEVYDNYNAYDIASGLKICQERYLKDCEKIVNEQLLNKIKEARKNNLVKVFVRLMEELNSDEDWGDDL